MEIAGKYKEHYYIMRCCNEGKWEIREGGNGSGICGCRHTGYTTCYDYLDVKTLKKVTDKEIIKEMESSESYKLYEHRFK